MSYRPPEVFEKLFDHVLGTGNVHRLQIVRYAQHRNSPIGLECREYVHPRNVAAHDPAIRRFDKNGWGHGFVKMLRSEHIDWLGDNMEKVQSLIIRYRVKVLEDSLDGWGRRIG